MKPFVEGPDPTPPPERSWTRALLHRWLIEYNPLYLISAALVFAGLTVVSREVGSIDSIWAHLGVPAIAELYAFSLIGGAALLVRLGSRRPAVLLGLLCVAFQGDLTLHVETCSYLGLTGVVASSVWMLLFSSKLYLLSRAMELRLSRSAVAVALFGALGLAVLPHLLRAGEPDTQSTVVMLWLFGLGTLATWTRRNVESAVGWDIRGRRCIGAVWAIWAALALGHATFWAYDYHFSIAPALMAVPLVAVRYARRESRVWLAIGSTLAACSQLAPRQLWIVALMAASTLLLTAMQARFERSIRRRRPDAPPYRSYEPLVSEADEVVRDLSPGAKQRLSIGALFALYVAGWSWGWQGGELPEHRLWLDALFCAACVAASLRWRRRLVVAPIVPVLAHVSIQREWITEPTTALGWGATCVGAGFAILFGALVGTWLATRHPSRPLEDLRPAVSPRRSKRRLRRR